jgi:hypothetical protein
MSFSMVFTDKNDYLLCITDGMVDGADGYIAWGLEAIGRIRQTHHTKILFDNRTFRLELSSLDIVLFAQKYEELNVPVLGLRMAVLSCSKNDAVSRLIETTLINRSATYRRFESQEEAKKWLYQQGAFGIAGDG